MEWLIGLSKLGMEHGPCLGLFVLGLGLSAGLRILHLREFREMRRLLRELEESEPPAPSSHGPGSNGAAS